jgi:hypothetical protein
VLHVMLFHPWNMLCTFTLALFPQYVFSAQYGRLCIYLISCFLGMLL